MSDVMKLIGKYAPVLRWAPRYNRAALADDFLAAVIVTIMLIPQSLAYALIAGLPPEAGLYASIAPLILYAIFGTSTSLAVGPVAVISLMTAATVGDFAARGTAGYASVALALAFIVGLVLLALGLLRLGFLANFLSHPIISGFITASGVLIAASQMKHILGVKAEGDNLIEIAYSLGAHLPATHLPTLAIGAGVIGFLFWTRSNLKPLLVGWGLKDRPAALLTRAAPLLAINSADDQVNPPELGILESEIRKVRNGRAILLPITDETVGHGTHSRPAIWGEYLREFLEETAK